MNMTGSAFISYLKLILYSSIIMKWLMILMMISTVAAAVVVVVVVVVVVLLWEIIADKCSCNPGLNEAFVFILFPLSSSWAQQYALAYGTLSEVLRRDPTSHSTLAAQGRLLLQAGDYSSATAWVCWRRGGAVVPREINCATWADS